MLDNMRWIVFLFKIYLTFYLYVCSLIFSVFFFFLHSSQLNIHFIESNFFKIWENGFGQCTCILLFIRLSERKLHAIGSNCIV